MRIICRQRLLKVMVISLVIVLGLGVLPCTAQTDTYRLAELITGGKISVGTLEFSNFGFTSSGFGSPAANPAGIFVEAVGIDTAQPGLRVLANNQLSVSGAMTVFQVSNLTYNVKDTTESIQGRSLLLVPSSAASGSSNQLLVHEDITGSDRITASRTVPPNPTMPDELLAEADFSDPQEFLSITTIILIQAKSEGSDELGQVGIRALEQRFKLASTRADAGPDQVVQDSVMLDGSGSEGNGLTYEWKLIPRDPSLEDITPEPSMNPILEVKGLVKGLYDVTLTVTDENGLLDTDTMLLASAGACEEQDGSLPAELHLWRFKIKKYKYCNWAFARVYGTVDASDLPLDSSINQDGLKAKVILQLIDQNKKIVGEYSGEIPAEIKDRRYKYVIRNKW